jgi:hypothetical protein
VAVLARCCIAWQVVHAAEARSVGIATLRTSATLPGAGGGPARAPESGVRGVAALFSSAFAQIALPPPGVAEAGDDCRHARSSSASARQVADQRCRA